MNSNYDKKSFDFDLGINKSSSRSLNDQKNQNSKPNTTSSWTTHQPNYNTNNKNKASWTHQPVGSLSGPTSMVGDIFGKSWGSANQNSGIGVVKKDPNLFGDLFNSALGQNKGNSSSNVPLKNAAPLSDKSSFSMGGFADSLPKAGNSSKSSGNWGESSESLGSYTSGFSGNSSGGGNVNLNGGGSKGGNIGGPSMKSMAGIGGNGGIGSKKDPFGSLVDFSSKSGGTLNSGNKGSSKSSVADDAFGGFQDATKTSGTTFASSSFTPVNKNSTGPGVGGSYPNVDDFAFFNSQPTNQPSDKSSGGDDFDALFSSNNVSSGGATLGNAGIESQKFSGGDEWGLDSEFGGGHDTGGTTELEGLPPPPAGVSAAGAKNKGLDNYKQGQYADAIKWLSWAVILLEKSGDDAGAMEVLTCRASCYKEVGEYKKAVADCTKALEQDGKNVTILVQRALLYESMEKYKLGAEDLRIVMKIDPGNRVARSTIHRLTKMAE